MLFQMQTFEIILSLFFKVFIETKKLIDIIKFNIIKLFKVLESLNNFKFVYTLKNIQPHELLCVTF